MKRIISLTLSVLTVLGLVLSFSGCNKYKDEIVGKWRSKLNIAGLVNTELVQNEKTAKYIEDIQFAVKMYYVFGDDGVYETYIDSSEAQTALEKYKTDVRAGMLKYFANELDAKEDAVDEILASAGSSVDAVVEKMFAGFVLDNVTAEFSAKGKYKVTEDKIYFSSSADEDINDGSYITYGFTDTRLKLTEAFGDCDTAIITYPIYLMKQ